MVKKGKKNKKSKTPGVPRLSKKMMSEKLLAEKVKNTDYVAQRELLLKRLQEKRVHENKIRNLSIDPMRKNYARKADPNFDPDAIAKLIPTTKGKDKKVKTKEFKDKTAKTLAKFDPELLKKHFDSHIKGSGADVQPFMNMMKQTEEEREKLEEEVSIDDLPVPKEHLYNVDNDGQGEIDFTSTFTGVDVSEILQ